MENAHVFVDESRHLGTDYLANSEIYKNTKFEENQSLFNITQELAMEHSEEILNVTCLEYSSPFWARLVLSHDQAIKWAKAKVCVYADSVLCVGQMKDSPGATERWKGQVEGLRLYSSDQDAVGIDGEAIEFEWTKFLQGFFFIIGYSSRDPKRIDENETSSAEEFKRRDHLCVNVQ